MLTLFNLFKKFNKPKRLPAVGGNVLALTGAVVIHTHDEHNVVLTPSLARQIAQVLPGLADQAERHSHEENPRIPHRS